MNHRLELANAAVCRLAACREDFEQAFRLLYDRYLASGLTRPNRLKMRIAEHQLRPDCQIIVAEQHRRIVGTVSLVADGPSMLPLETVFAGAVCNLRKAGAKLVEVGCLAALSSSSQLHSPIFVSLTRATIHNARHRGFGRMLAAVHPRHVTFYERGMGFQRLSKTVSYDFVEGKSAICVAGDPNEPLQYRQPWRDLFFGGQLHQVLPVSGGGMSDADRRYFTKLCEQVGHGDARRAA